MDADALRIFVVVSDHTPAHVLRALASRHGAVRSVWKSEWPRSDGCCDAIIVARTAADADAIIDGLDNLELDYVRLRPRYARPRAREPR